MKNELKVFVADYIELCKQSCKWLKKHWKGYLIFCVIWGTIWGLIAYIKCEKHKREFNESMAEWNRINKYNI